MVATGTGIAPYRAYLRRMFMEDVPNYKFTGLAWLFMGVANSDAKLYDDEFQAISKKFPKQASEPRNMKTSSSLRGNLERLDVHRSTEKSFRLLSWHCSKADKSLSSCQRSYKSAVVSVWCAVKLRATEFASMNCNNMKKY